MDLIKELSLMKREQLELGVMPSFRNLSQSSKKMIRDIIIDILCDIDGIDISSLTIKWTDAGIFWSGDGGKILRSGVNIGKYYDMEWIYFPVSYRMDIDECKIGEFIVGYDIIGCNRTVKIKGEQFYNIVKERLRDKKLKKIIK